MHINLRPQAGSCQVDSADLFAHEGVALVAPMHRHQFPGEAWAGKKMNK